MYWSILILFFTIVTAVLGFLGLGEGPIEAAKIIFYILCFLLLISFVLEGRKKQRRFYE